MEGIMKNGNSNIKSVYSFSSNNKGTRVVTILITVIVLLSGITIIPFNPIIGNAFADPAEIWFDLTCKDPIKEVGNGNELTRTAIYIIEVTNYRESGPSYDVEIFIEEVSDFDNWSAELYYPPQSGQSVTVTLNPSSPIKTKVVSLEVTAESTAPEDWSTAVKVNGTAEGADKQLIYIQTRMNSYEPNLFCKRPRELIVPGNSVNYTINVTNDGKLTDTIDMEYSQPSSRWGVNLYYFDTGQELFDTETEANQDGIPDTGPIVSGSFRVIRAEVTAPSDAQKYHQELIYINASTNTDPGGTVYVAPQSTVSTVIDLAFCISDSVNSGPDKYYEEGEFTGHNVNPGMMTSYEIYIFKTSVDQQETRLNISYSSNPSWQAILEWNGNPGNPDVDVPAPSNIGDYNIAFLNITAPTNAKIENEFIVNVTADEDPSSGIDDYINITTKVIVEKKVYLIVFNGINAESIDLNMNYGPYNGTGERLWPNLWKLIDYGVSRYGYTIDILPAFADSDWTSVLTSSYAGTNGIHGVGAHVTGFNETSDIIEGNWYHHENIHVNTIFNTIKSCNPNIRTSAIGGKNFTIDMIDDEDIDITVTPYKKPFYVPEPEPYKMGNVYFGTGLQEWMLVNIPSDGWVFNATMAVIAHEDPDFIFIENIESDNAGHFYGSEIDGTPEYQRANINKFAQPQYTLDVVHNLDMHLGRFIDYMENWKGVEQNNALNDSLIVISADHGMKTYWAPPNTTVDIREILEDKNIIMGRDYKYCLGTGAPVAFIYNFTTTAIRDEAKSVLENYTDAEDKSPIWKILDFEGMNGSSDHYPSEGQPFGLYDELMAEQGIGGLFPEMFVFTHARYQVPFYPDSSMAIGKTFMFEKTAPIWWEEGNLTVLVGNHATYDEQLVPLIFHGPGIKKGYFSDDRVEALDIIPTICEINGWNDLAHGYFDDHVAEGEALWNCLPPRSMNIGLLGEVETLDPALAIDMNSEQVIAQIYDGLVKINANSEIVPSLAESWDVENEGLTWIFGLREDVIWHDRYPLTAYDVNYTFERILDPATHSPKILNYIMIEDIMVEDEHTVVFNLNEPNAAFLQYMTIGIVPEEYDPEEPIGTGPFKFERWDSNYIKLVRNTEYFNGVPYLEELRFLFYPSSEQILLSMLYSELDLWIDVPPEYLDILDESSAIDIFESDMISYDSIILNNSYEPFQDPRVRLALVYGTNRVTLVNEVLQDHGEIATGPIHPLSIGYYCNPCPYYPDNATKLLKAAGYDPMTVTLTVQEGDSVGEDMASLISQQLEEINITVDIRSLGWSQYIQAIASGDFEMLLRRTNMLTLDTDYLYNQFNTSAIELGQNYASYSNVTVDDLLTQGREETEESFRTGNYTHIQELLTDPDHNEPVSSSTMPHVFIDYPTQIHAINAQFYRYTQLPTGIIELRDI